MNDSSPPNGGESQLSRRMELADQIRSLDPTTRTQRFAVGYGKPGHVDDEVIVTLMLQAWRSDQEQECSTYASEVLRRVTKHVRAHVRKNPGWQRLGGGAFTITEDLCQDVVYSILQDGTMPCHAEVAFGNYVYRRCLDEAAKLYAKKHSAGEPLEEDQVANAATTIGNSVDPPTELLTPEQMMMEFQEMIAEKSTLEKIRNIMHEDFPELPRLALTFRYFAGLKIESKKDQEVTVTKLMGVNEKTATKYINQAIALIKQRLSK